MNTAFRDGKPNELDTVWSATGNVTRNGQPYGNLQISPDVNGTFIHLYLVTPAGQVSLQSWQTGQFID